MNIINNERVTCYDVDETLIIHTKNDARLNNTPYIEDKRINEKFYYKPYTEHIQLLKQMKARGQFIIVWSAGGYEWARMVIEELGLQDYVDLIMTKPSAYVDDKDANDFMERIYLPRKE